MKMVVSSGTKSSCSDESSEALPPSSNEVFCCFCVGLGAFEAAGGVTFFFFFGFFGFVNRARLGDLRGDNG